MTFNVWAVIDAVTTVYNPQVPNEQRIVASKFIEAAKDSSPQDLEALGYELIANNDVRVVHVGWSFIEHIIKFCWLDLNEDSRISVRNGCFAHARNEKVNLPEVKNAFCRCIVSIAEHEWPQNWPEFFDQLEQLSTISLSHAELPFRILQRLVEDVVTICTIENAQRRKDLNTSIVTEIPKIFSFISCALESPRSRNGMILLSLNVYFLLRCITEDHISLVCCALSLLAEIVEWIPSKVLDLHLDKLLEVVCSFLSGNDFSICDKAANCLLRIASRKHIKNDENLVVMALFGDIPMQSILASASSAASVGPNNAVHYRYLKTLCDVLSALGIQLSDVWKRAPPNFEMYLRANEAFITHPSVYLRNEAATVYASFIVHSEIVEDDTFSQSLSRIIPKVPKLLEKIGLPSLGDSEASLYSQIDFDDDADFFQCFIRYRERLLKVVRGACDDRHIYELLTITEDWIKNQCIVNPHSILDKEWEAMLRFIRVVLNECHTESFFDDTQYQIFTGLFDGVLMVLSSITAPSHLVNNLLSVLSALFLILESCPDRVTPILLLLRRFLLEEVDEMSEEKSVKRHCLSVLLKLVTYYADVVRSSLSPMQQASCTQVVAALGNLCGDFAMQCNFISCAVQETVLYFSTPEVLSATEGDSGFLSFIGLSSPAPLNNEEARQSLFIHNRVVTILQLRANLATIEGMLMQVRSISPPAHPAFPALRPILPTLFSFAEYGIILRRVNSLYESHCSSLIHPSYGPTVVDITAADRQQLLSAIDPLASVSLSRNQTDDPKSHARSFISDVTDYVQSITGLLASAMPAELFLEPCVSAWCMQLVSHISYVPDFRLRFWIRRSWRPLLTSCPQRLYSTLYISKIFIAAEDQEPTKEQLFEEHMTCVLTRETVALLRALFRIHDSGEERNDGPSCVITKQIMEDKVIFEGIVALAFHCLTFSDASSTIRVIPICRSIVETVFPLGRCDESMAIFMLVRSIQSLQVHGSDDVALGFLLILIFHVYYSLREGCENLVRVLQQVPQCNFECVDAYDKRIMSMRQNKEVVYDKCKREMTKKLLRPLISVQVGLQHRRPVHLRIQPPLSKPVKPVIEDFTDLGLLFTTV
uniref:Xpo1 domain-containing protein n=1 Tax=Syphacia muris TaxID=451379 RepID=A0A158R678_9BILA